MPAILSARVALVKKDYMVQHFKKNKVGAKFLYLRSRTPAGFLI